MADDVLEQARRLLEEEEITPSEAWLRHWSSTVCNRLCLRLHAQRLPDMFASIADDAVIKLYRRYYYEGVSSESDGGVSVNFVEDVLNEYASEISEYNQKNSSGVQFL